jgi:ribA/ribD-fused uncharacterized protein
MAQSIGELVVAEAQNQLPPFLYFWGHRPSTPGTGPWCLSQWWPAPFTVDGVEYWTAEHYMMATKARLFGDDSIIDSILSVEDPCQAKAFGRQVRGFDEQSWKRNRYSIVKRGNLEKFRQNPELNGYLCSTSGYFLVEASPFDTVWGIGLDANDERAKRPSEWRGENLLGFVLMDVRDVVARAEGP